MSGIYLTAKEVEISKMFLIETTAIMNNARKTMHKSYPNLFDDDDPPMPDPSKAGSPPEVDLSNPIQKGGKIEE